MGYNVTLNFQWKVSFKALVFFGNIKSGTRLRWCLVFSKISEFVDESILRFDCSY